MSDNAGLPVSWSKAKIGDLCTALQYGYTASATSEACGPRFLRITDIQDGTVVWPTVPYCAIEDEQIERFLLHPGDIVFARTGGTVGKSYIITSVPETSVFASYLIRLTPHRAIHPKFLYHFFQSASYWEQIGFKKGGLQGNVNATTLSTLEIPLCPVSEQHRIVAKIEELLSELDRGIDALYTARQQLTIYRQSVLTYAFEGKLTEDWRKRHKSELRSTAEMYAHLASERQAHHKQLLATYEADLRKWEKAGKKGIKPSRVRALKPVSPLSQEVLKTLPTLPDGWTWQKLAWMTCGVEYGTAAKSTKTGAVPVIRMGNLQSGRIDWTDLVFTSDADEIAQYSLCPGDVLFNRTNSPELVGKTAIYRGERPALFAGYLIRVNHNTAVVDSQYLNLLLNSHVARKHGNTVKTDGVNQSNINGEKLQNYPFPFCSLAEQQEIVRLLDEKLSHSDQLLSEIDDHLVRANALRQSILKRAFSGQLVTQDATDEPASALLSRIRAEREKSEPKKKRNGKNGKKNAA